MIFICGTSFSADRYVSPPGGYGTNDTTGGYTNWLGAATNIQWAVNKAVAGETIWVTNGTYYLTNQISFTNGITVRSVNGRDVTIVNGNYPLYTNRCFYVTNGGTLVQGFTVTNGFIWGSGAGAYLKNGATVRNCIISGNTARDSDGGGVYISGAGTVDLCSVVGNVSTGTAYGGGGIFGGGTVTNSTIAWNLAVITSAPGYYAGGGGAFMWGGLIQNCTIASNNAQLFAGYGGGGGAYLFYGLILNSTISGNTGTNNSRAGGVLMAFASTLRNCLIVNNNSYGLQAGGVTCLDWLGTIQNCTMVGNRGDPGGVYIYGYYNNYELIENCVIVSNYTFAGSLANWEFGNEKTNIYVVNTCTYPTNFTAGVTNIACISNNPAFVNYPAGNYRLVNNSPAVNTGTNQSWMTNAVDLDGRARIRYGIVDMGAYERIHEATIYRFY